MSKRITQVEAHRMRRELRAMKESEERRKSLYATEFPGTSIATFVPNDELFTACKTAMRLNHAVLLRIGYSGKEMNCFAVPVNGEEPPK